MERKQVALLCSILSTSLLQTPPAHSCATIIADDRGSVRIADEAAVIVWDEKRHVEHFVRQANFETGARDLGFLVPTPNTPDLAEANGQAFTVLTQSMEPEHQVRTRWKITWEPLGISLKSGFNAASASIATSTGEGVDVVATAKVAGYDATVLSADDTPALERWLELHHYPASAPLMAWLRPYVAAHWKITAFKIAKGLSNSEEVSTGLVRMSFVTERPFYPYSEPQGTTNQTVGTSRLLRVFVLSSERMKGSIGETPNGRWPGLVTWTNQLRLESDKEELLANNLALRPEQLPGNLWMTSFEDPSSPRNGKADVWFARDDDQASIVPPPIVTYRDVDVPVPLIFLYLGIALVVVRVIARRLRYGRQAG